MVIVFIVLGVVLVSVVEGKKTFDMFGEGVREGLNTVVNLFPTLLGLFLAVNLLRSSGFLDFLTDSFENIFAFLKFPKELIGLFVLKPISGSASLAMATDIIKKYGVDSNVGLMSAVILGATETTLYAMAVYTGEIKKKIPTKLITLAIFGNFLGVFLSMIICNLYFN